MRYKLGFKIYIIVQKFSSIDGVFIIHYLRDKGIYGKVDPRSKSHYWWVYDYIVKKN